MELFIFVFIIINLFIFLIISLALAWVLFQDFSRGGESALEVFWSTVSGDKVLML